MRLTLISGLTLLASGCAPPPFWHRDAAAPAMEAEPPAAIAPDGPQTTPMVEAAVAMPEPAPESALAEHPEIAPSAPDSSAAPALAETAEPAAVPAEPAPEPSPEPPFAPVFDRDTALASLVSLQAPAWIERAGMKSALKPGDTVLADDRLLTAANGRVQLKLANGATLTLGGDATLEFGLPLPAPQDHGSLVAGLKLLRGSALYIAGAPTAEPPALEIAMSPAASLSTQGERFLLRAGRKGVLCNLGHRLHVARDRGGPLSAERPNRCHDLARLAAGKPAPAFEDPRLRKWIAATKFRLDGSTQITQGAWAVSVAALREAAAAEPMLSRLRAAGYAADVTDMPANDAQYRSRILVPLFATREDARRFAQTVAPKLGFRGAWPLEAPL